MIKVGGGLSAEVGDTAVEMDELIGEPKKVEINRATSGAVYFLGELCTVAIWRLEDR